MIMEAKYSGKCIYCDRRPIVEGETINWDPEEKSASHIKCFKKHQALASLALISNYIRATDKSPNEITIPEGKKVINEKNRYGDRYCCIIGADWIWYVQTNSGDGTCNVEGFGTEGIGWKVPYDEGLEQKIRAVAAMFNKARAMPKISGNPISNWVRPTARIR